jgi:serine/threonine protein kinase
MFFYILSFLLFSKVNLAVDKCKCLEHCNKIASIYELFSIKERIEKPSRKEFFQYARNSPIACIFSKSHIFKLSRDSFEDSLKKELLKVLGCQGSKIRLSAPTSHYRSYVFAAVIYIDDKPAYFIKLLSNNKFYRRYQRVGDFFKKKEPPIQEFSAALVGNLYLEKILSSENVCHFSHIGLFNEPGDDGCWVLMPYIPGFPVSSMLIQNHTKTEQALLALGKILGTLHAKTQNFYTESESCLTVKNFYEARVEMYRKNAQQVIKKESQEQQKIFQRIIADLNTYQKKDTSTPFYSTCHGDANLDNFIYSPDSDQIKIIDNNWLPLNTHLSVKILPSTEKQQEIIGCGEIAFDFAKIIVSLLRDTPADNEEKRAKRILKNLVHFFKGYSQFISPKYISAMYERTNFFVESVLLKKLLLHREPKQQVCYQMCAKIYFDIQEKVKTLMTHLKEKAQES